MENAADALKMAFAVFVFVVAISLTLSSFTKAKDAADAILGYSDKTNYYEWAESSSQEQGREVTKDAIIASLFRKQTDTYIIVNISSSEKYIFTYYGTVTKIKNGTATNFNTKVLPTAPNYFDLINFANTTLKDPDKPARPYIYYENIVEVTNKSSLGGEYVIGDDGTKIQVTPGDNKIILTYTRK